MSQCLPAKTLAPATSSVDRPRRVGLLAEHLPFHILRGHSFCQGCKIRGTTAFGCESLDMAAALRAHQGQTGSISSVGGTESKDVLALQSAAMEN